MEYRELKNYGQLYTPKASARVLMPCLASIPKELGVIGTPKFLAKLQSKDRYWKKKHFRTAEERGFTDKEFIEGIQYTLAFYTAMIAACGREKTSCFYPKFVEKLGVMMHEEFFPAAEDFLQCGDCWQACREYFHEFFQVYQREGGMRYEVVQDTESDFQVHVTDCAWEFMWREAGYPELAAIGGECDVIFIPRLMQGIGGDFKRESWLCKGDATCDWHFFRHKARN